MHSTIIAVGVGRAALVVEWPDAGDAERDIDDAEAPRPAVIVSDSFGRPWRFGIVDVALGVAGIRPLDDQRGTPDADGRPMHSTIIAVADEIASAAELVAGKTSHRPVVLIRGDFEAADGRAAEIVMPAEMDLFR
ncbi:MAG TPA: coenzyme F420-0:L-glutamate ligase, partial [Candidatus Limnocylindria bacterium]|nr:coenzyme F420-0:L-glutamate ligase [Candidatus Limnocylindria bacterium]